MLSPNPQSATNRISFVCGDGQFLGGNGQWTDFVDLVYSYMSLSFPKYRITTGLRRSLVSYLSMQSCPMTTSLKARLLRKSPFSMSGGNSDRLNLICYLVLVGTSLMHDEFDQLPVSIDIRRKKRLSCHVCHIKAGRPSWSRFFRRSRLHQICPIRPRECKPMMRYLSMLTFTWRISLRLEEHTVTTTAEPKILDWQQRCVARVVPAVDERVDGPGDGLYQGEKARGGRRCFGGERCVWVMWPGGGSQRASLIDRPSRVTC